MPVYLQSLLQELPLSTTDYSFATPSTLDSGRQNTAGVIELLRLLSGATISPQPGVSEEGEKA
jgi:hypothetical protein